MQRSPANLSKNFARKFLNPGGRNPIRTIPSPSCAVFLNHRGDDTRKTLAGLLYDHLFRLRLRPFLDSRNMKPGDKLFDQIDIAIRNCKVGVAVFSPRYCESKFCLYELALIMESKKRVIPIFWDVKPSQLLVKDNGTCSVEELQRFSLALEEVKYTVGLAFDSSTGDWSEFLRRASHAIIENLLELERRAWLVILESINAHEDDVNAFFAGFDAFVFTSSADGTIKVWRRELQNQALPGSGFVETGKCDDSVSRKQIVSRCIMQILRCAGEILGMQEEVE
ncbi:TMV resistance protein N-like [Juglans regia]|uniref:TMV resistance protein N-like n=1 Tax=Juglans regia TaxID=51240 RepID=A0A6P9EA17_JUGRE|nr:TMV resistance protein N-like [Juglans regia]